MSESKKPINPKIAKAMIIVAKGIELFDTDC